MKLNSDLNPGVNTVTGYGAGYVAVNGRRYERSLIVERNRIDTDWPAASAAALSAELLAPLAARQCDVLLLGTGERQRFPSPALLRPLIEARIAVEVMDTGAACRTYNVLLAEGRNPLAVLIVEAAP
ncbi:MAG: MTH938/NDUFAF3 family protein [Rhodocyclaceae bacterium]|nr:MTH938/NDUFAF3 family protein [Rhodocyclaceae bacterium]